MLHIQLDIIYLAMCISSSFLSLLSSGQPGRRNSISCTSAIPDRCTQPLNNIPFTYKRQDIQGKVSNHPPHIAAHLQGTQNPPHKSQPCKRAAIANTRQTFFQFGQTKYKKEKTGKPPDGGFPVFKTGHFRHPMKKPNINYLTNSNFLQN